ASNIEAALQAWADAHAEGNFGAAGMPLRVAVTGGTTSPPLPDTLAILGKASVLRRIERCVASAPDFAS
ncbi:MAG: glutamate--tRNA ligase, partial [Planctomycetota bacterium]|nr:glutamate--tRNA ligase [Planctomycetota bacterium]